MALPALALLFTPPDAAAPERPQQENASKQNAFSAILNTNNKKDTSTVKQQNTTTTGTTAEQPLETKKPFTHNKEQPSDENTEDNQYLQKQQEQYDEKINGTSPILTFIMPTPLAVVPLPPVAVTVPVVTSLEHPPLIQHSSTLPATAQEASVSTLNIMSLAPQAHTDSSPLATAADQKTTPTLPEAIFQTKTIPSTLETTKELSFLGKDNAIFPSLQATPLITAPTNPDDRAAMAQLTPNQKQLYKNELPTTLAQSSAVETAGIGTATSINPLNQKHDVVPNIIDTTKQVFIIPSIPARNDTASTTTADATIIAPPEPATTVPVKAPAQAIYAIATNETAIASPIPATNETAIASSIPARNDTASPTTAGVTIIAPPEPATIVPVKAPAQAIYAIATNETAIASSIPARNDTASPTTADATIIAPPEPATIVPVKVPAQAVNSIEPIAKTESSLPMKSEPAKEIPSAAPAESLQKIFLVNPPEPQTPTHDAAPQDTQNQVKSTDTLAIPQATTNTPLPQQQAATPQPVATPLPQNLPHPLAAHASIYRPAHEQVAIAVRKASQDGVEQISVRLKPEHLGTIDVKMSIASDGTVQTVLSADKPETVHWLRQDAAQLERSLQDAGLKTESGSMQFQLRQDTGQNNNGQRQAEPSTTSARPLITATKNAETPQATWVRPGGINMRV
ncbi:MAG: flagellar hook-length control protein FliK [Holosporales bacterium]